MDVFWTIIISFLSAVGLITLFSWAMPLWKDKNCTFYYCTLLPLFSGEDLEWRLRWGFSLAKWGSGHFLRQLVLVDMGLTDEERDLCVHFCRERDMNVRLIPLNEVENLL